MINKLLTGKKKGEIKQLRLTMKIYIVNLFFKVFFGF
jgi:hypothetical protein